MASASSVEPTPSDWEDRVTRLQDNVDLVGLGSFVRFLSWPDFLLGLSAGSNGTGFSNVFASFDDFGLTNSRIPGVGGCRFRTG